MLKRLSEIFIFLAFAGFLTSVVAAARTSSMLYGFSVKAYGQFTICALVFSIALSLLEMNRPQK